MNDPKIATARLEEIISAAHPDRLTLPESCALYAATEALCGQLRDHVEETASSDGYAFEKIGQVRWHIGAALGFDTDNGHDAGQHRVWALGSLESLNSRLAG